MRRALWFMHISTLFFGLSGVFAALINTSALVAVFGRAFFALLLLSVLAFFQRKSWVKLSFADIFRLLFIAILLLIHWMVFFLAIHKGGVAVGTLGFACFPVVVTILEFFIFKEKITASEIVQITLVSFGLILVTPNFEFTDQLTIGLLLGILSGVIYAVIAIFNRLGMTRNQASAIQGCCWQFFGIVIFSFPFVYNELFRVSYQDMFWIACLGIFSTGIAYVLFIKSLETIKARMASMIISLETVYAIVIAWLFLYQVPSWRMLVGGLVIIGAVVLIPRKA